jgi:hypothetical protein
MDYIEARLRGAAVMPGSPEYQDQLARSEKDQATMPEMKGTARRTAEF